MTKPLSGKAFLTISRTVFGVPCRRESGEKALEIMEKESPDGAIVDIRMRGMDGNAFIRKAVLKRPETAFVICTGSPEYDIPADLLRLTGVSGHIFKKPVTDPAGLEEELLRLDYGNCSKEGLR